MPHRIQTDDDGCYVSEDGKVEHKRGDVDIGHREDERGAHHDAGHDHAHEDLVAGLVKRLLEQQKVRPLEIDPDGPAREAAEHPVQVAGGLDNGIHRFED